MKNFFYNEPSMNVMEIYLMTFFKKAAFLACALMTASSSVSAGAFEGLSAGLLVGTGSAAMEQKNTNDKVIKNLTKNVNGMSFGLTVTYGLEVANDLVIAPDFHFSMFSAKVEADTENTKGKTSMALGVRFGMALRNAFPFIRVGYAMNGVEFEDTAAKQKKSINFSSLEYGLGVDTQVTPEITVGMEGAATFKSEKEVFKPNKKKVGFSRFSLRILYNF